ncbi:UDP-N-acetyl-D-mannosamine dehydrogenase [Achromobacter marplatensis]|uniref:UDP-N-acetyl-D-mannosaminuronic acid dehydrogenase n=1 Tax=Achromobacter marplatensis TaxID=470868 RepID=A0ABX9GMQ6_9BURK|nr:nucleotide sugar dehydrogenase [Achromobacter marplatensis]OWT72316.1 UDP-N-acetyl-D-mannosamine dehydrogenase [Achromobacter marplatensis]RBP24397.1 UDP-N-acetyl-D-mannosaminuronic acid dehydrogenase [Achromobacter marplatensis]CAB3626852.1 UDP-N-acetyl-D-mannosamine dehydrogenase [Achromobacter marplatensis]
MQVAVYGLGYIGLPTAAVFAAEGNRVHGVDINRDLVDAINSATLSHPEPGLDVLVNTSVKSEKLLASVTPVAADVHLVSVPTPLDGEYRTDLSFVFAAIDSICSVLEAGNIIILESTCPVGTTERVLQYILDARPDLCSVDGEAAISIAYCPERVIPGNILSELTQNVRIVGGVDEGSGQKAAAVLRKALGVDVVITSSRVAELAKVTENTYRDVNIAFANELAMVCDDVGVNANELISVANLHPRVNILKPSCGVGGHCIPVSPWILMGSTNHNTQLIRAARAVDTDRRNFVATKVLNLVNQLLEQDTQARVAVLGVTYKADSSDCRNSAAMALASSIVHRWNGRVDIYDHFASADALAPKILREVPTVGTLLKRNTKLVVMLVPHHDYRELVQEAGKSGVSCVDFS